MLPREDIKTPYVGYSNIQLVYQIIPALICCRLSAKESFLSAVPLNSLESVY